MSELSAVVPYPMIWQVKALQDKLAQSEKRASDLHQKVTRRPLLVQVVADASCDGVMVLCQFLPNQSMPACI